MKAVSKIHPTTKDITELLLTEDNLDILEGLLEEEGDMVKRLESLDGQYGVNWGYIITQSKAEKIFLKIKADVDEFLGVDEIESPKIKLGSKYTFLPIGGIYLRIVNLIYPKADIVGVPRLYRPSSFDPENLLINLREDREIPAKLALAHEYTHLVQYEKGIPFKCHEVIVEGQATGVTRHLAKKYAETEDSWVYMYQVTLTTFRHLKGTYLWMCEKLCINPNKKLLEVKTIEDRYEDLTNTLFRKYYPKKHYLGDTFFLIQEKLNPQLGHKIYRDSLKGHYEFLKHFIPPI